MREDKHSICPENLVKQPTHRTIILDTPNEVEQEFKISVIGITKDEQRADVLQERITLTTCFPTKVIGITNTKFLITFPTLEHEEEIPVHSLSEWFTNIKETTHLDLVPPRLTWIYGDGLPYSMWNLKNWELIVGDWGKVISGNFKVLKCGMIQTPRICIQTYQVRDIKKTVKVVIDGKGYWVKNQIIKDLLSNGGNNLTIIT